LGLRSLGSPVTETEGVVASTTYRWNSSLACTFVMSVMTLAIRLSLLTLWKPSCVSVLFKLPLVETIHICGNRENLIELKFEMVLTVSTVMHVTLDSRFDNGVVHQ